MKQIILFLFSTLLIGLNLLETQNFYIENGHVIWKKVHKTDLTKEQIIQKIKNSGKFENILESKENLTAEINQLSMDFKGYGSSEMSTPMYIARNYVKAFVIIEFKEGRYRIILKNIKFLQKYDDELSKIGETTDLELFAVKKRNSVFKNSFLKKPSKIMDFTFQKITNFNGNTEKDKW